jgi:hypothetical protein
MTETNVITDRQRIADIVNAGLDELDQLRSKHQDAQRRVSEAQEAEAHAGEVYANKINEVLATGWATPQGLAAQGHEAPKRRIATGRSKRHSAHDTTPHNNGES